MISEEINEKIADALRAKDELRLSTLRLLSSALHNAKINKRGDLTEEEELAVVKKEAKKRQDAIEAYEKAGAEERAEKEKKELAILRQYLSEEMGDEELTNLVDEAIRKTGARDIKDMGKAIGVVMEKSKGRADGAKVAKLVKEKLGG